MMNCEAMERLLADAVGQELPTADRRKFDAHLEGCATCRREFESLSEAVERMRSLPGSARTTLGEEDVQVSAQGAQTPAIPMRRRPAGSILRFAASLLIAFTAGYAVHAVRVLGTSSAPLGSSRMVAGSSGDRVNIQRALRAAHERSPSSSDLAKCLSAMFPTKQ